MVKGIIKITTTGMIITPYQPGQSRYLEKLTSMYEKATHRWDALTGYTIAEDKDETKFRFITHVNSTSFIQGVFPEYMIETENVVKGKKMQSQYALNLDITPSEVQYNTIQEILSHPNSHQWFVYLSQGLGKTLLSVYLASLFNVKTLIMCYSTDILLQWKKTLKEKTSMDMTRVLLIDKSTILKLIHKGTFPVNDFDIFMCTPGLLTSFCKKNGFDLLSPTLKKMGIGFKIFDEAHRNIANIIKINAFSNIDRTLYLSGDFAQSNPRKDLLYKRMFHGVAIIQPSEELMNTLKYTEAIVVEYNSHPSVNETASIYTRRGFSGYDFMKYQFTTTVFFDVLDFIIGHISKANVEKYKILILVNMIDHVDILYDKLKDKYSDRYTLGRFHGKVDDEEKEFAKNTADMIVATYQSFSTGIDVTDIKFVISTTACTKIDDNQASGRARPLADGSSCFYFMMCDKGIAYVSKTIQYRLEYLTETKIKKITRIRY